ncbi:tyrosine-type recombinase/integrase [Ruegeria atlantica]|uniref:tyrosine-type recombinase/integrase n=1 Tax=Ruegeria atlantica TaxID=81569 RepID=UPI001481BF80
MGITKDRGRYYWVKRIPKRYAGHVLGEDGKPVTQVRQALHTDSEADAKVKAAQVEAARLAEWEALLVGDGQSARQYYESARKLAQARGYQYRPFPALLEGDPRELIERTISVTGENFTSKAAVQAVLGTVPEVLPSLIEVRNEYYELTKTRHVKKTPQQLTRWKNAKSRAVDNFLKVVAAKDARGKPVPMAVNLITRDDALKFRDWWAERVADGMDPATANKDFGHLSEIWKTWTELKKVDLENPFSKLRFEVKGKNKTKTPGFSRDWIVEKILAEGALDGMNEEARDIFLMTINTGLRPSEITDAPLEDFEVKHNVPFLRVTENGREIKIEHTERDIPLLGVSLEAARRIVKRGGITRYKYKANSWSAAVNKFLTENDLKETPKHTAYSMRHWVENALLAAKVDDRVRADILGHKYKRPSYGDGGALVGRREALELIAL